MNSKVDLWKLHRLWQGREIENIFCRSAEPFYRREVEARRGVFPRFAAWLRLDPAESLPPSLDLLPHRAGTMAGEEDLGHDGAPYLGCFLLLEENGL